MFNPWRKGARFSSANELLTGIQAVGRILLYHTPPPALI